MISMKRGLELLLLRPVRWVWRVCCLATGIFASAAQIQETKKEGYLTGSYNFRTRKFDDGTDPYGWYEEDL